MVACTALKVSREVDLRSPYAWLKFQIWRVCIRRVMDWTVEWYEIFVEIKNSSVFSIDPNFVSTKKLPIETFLEIIDFSGNSSMISKTQHNITRNPSSVKKIEVEGYLLPLATVHKFVHNEKVLNKKLLKIIDSSVRNPKEVKYDNQQLSRMSEKPEISRKICTVGHLLFSLHINWSMISSVDCLIFFQNFLLN